MANFTDAHDNDCDDEVQEYELAEADDDDRGRLVLQPGKFSIHIIRTYSCLHIQTLILSTVGYA